MRLNKSIQTLNNPLPLIIIRGDDDNIQLRFKDKTTGDYLEFSQSDILTFTLKEQEGNEILLQKNLSIADSTTALLQFDSTDTKELQFKNYQYDIQFIRDEKIKTIVPHSTFTIDVEVG